MNYKEQIQNKIEGLDKGSVFTYFDFSSIAPIEVIKKNLQRLEKDKIIRRVMRGVYDYPKYSIFLGELVDTDPDKVAQALARKHSWTILPNGDAALNILGLSTQVVSGYKYLSNGPYKQYEFNGIKLEFMHRTNKEITNLSFKTGLIVQAIKALGKNEDYTLIIKKLSRQLTQEVKEIMNEEAKFVTNWVYIIIKEISKSI
jgi:hypothetical protein